MRKTPQRPTTEADFSSGDWGHILASLEEGIILTDPEERITFFNPAAEQLTGLSRTQVLHCSYAQAFVASAWVVELIQRTLLSGHSRTAGEGELYDRYRRATPVRLTCSPIFNGGSTPLGLILVLHDLSHQKELAEEVQREDRLVQLSVIAAGLAHEIKNPLAGIRGAAQLLQGRVGNDSSALEYATVMIREIDRLSSLLTQLLELSTPTSLELLPMNVHKILTDVLLLEGRTVTGGVKLVTHFDPSLPDVLGDEARLAQVFRNLIKNGLQALAGRRGGVLTVSTRMATAFHILRSGHPSARRDRFLSIDFADNGPGITAEHLPRLFTPFFTTKSQGVGLGLALSQQIVAQHGGTIRVESAPGQGALFHVYLPVVPL
ncbi:MAG: two-component system sensor histidine kinase NtrB [Candidatus Binatia bacterium]